MTHDIHLSFDNLTPVSTGVQVKRGDFKSHTFNFIFEDVGADSYRVRLKNASGECAESDILSEPSYTLGAFGTSMAGLVNAELSAYADGKRITSATFTYEVIGDISTDQIVNDDDRMPAFDSLLKKVDEKFARYPEVDKIATLSGGKLTPSQLPSLAVNEVFTVKSAEEMTTLDAQRGDVAVFTYDSNSVSTEKPESMIKNTILVNQTIDGKETVESLRDEGILLSVTPTHIYGIHGIDMWGDSEDGVYWKGSSSPKTKYSNILSGDYTINVSTKIDINHMRYYINYADGNNYYMLSLNYNGELTAKKVLDGVSYDLEPIGTKGEVVFHSRSCNTEIKVENVSGGGIKISLVSADNVPSHAKCSYEIIDDGKIFGEAITEGYFALSPSYCKWMSLYMLKIVKHEEFGQNIATKLRDTYILSTDDPTNLDDWIKFGVSYTEYSGNSAYAQNAGNAHTINGHRIIEMSKADFEKAVKDPNTYYLVY